MKENVLEIIDLLGNKKTYDIMMTFDSEKTLKSYVVYTNYEKGVDGKIIVYASTYENINGNLILRNVNTKEEASFINDFLKEQQDEIKYIIKSKNE